MMRSPMSERPQPLVDCHVHLQDDLLYGTVDRVMDEARAAGVAQFVCNGTCEDDWPRVLALAEKHPDVVPSFGLHPWYVSERSATWLSKLDEMLGAIPSAVGEIGLDRWIEPRDEAAQEEAFRAQLELSRRHARPVTIHCVRAWGWLMEVLGDEAPLPAGMPVHAFAGATELIAPLAEQGAHFSFAASVLKGKNRRVRAACAAVPEGRLLIETDAPDFLPPRKYRTHVVRAGDGQPQNHPANLLAVLDGVAELRGETPKRIAAVVWQNAARLFGELMSP